MNSETPVNPNAVDRIFEPVVRSTLHERIYDQIHDAFASGMVIPGQRIVIREFARAFGTSMMPIREAFRRLEAENAIVATTGRNLAVPVMSASDYQELCLIRIAVEGLAAAESAKNITEAEIEEVNNAASQMEDASDRKDIEGTMRHNRNFHFLVYKGAHRPLLLKTIESLWLRVGPQLAYSIRHDIHGGDVVRSPYHPHRQIVAALRARDSGAASLAVSYDISRAARIIVEHLKQAWPAADEQAAATPSLPTGRKRSADG